MKYLKYLAPPIAFTIIGGAAYLNVTWWDYLNSGAISPNMRTALCWASFAGYTAIIALMYHEGMEYAERRGW